MRAIKTEEGSTQELGEGELENGELHTVVKCESSQPWRTLLLQHRLICNIAM